MEENNNPQSDINKLVEQIAEWAKIDTDKKSCFVICTDRTGKNTVYSCFLAGQPTQVLASILRGCHENRDFERIVTSAAEFLKDPELLKILDSKDDKINLN